MRLSLVFFVVVVAAGTAAWQAETRAELALRLLLRSTTVQLAPYGELSYGETRAHFWHRGSIDDLRFLPKASVRASLPWRGTEALHVPRLEYRGWQQDSPWPRAIELRFDDATLPLEAPWPSRSSGRIEWYHAPERRELELRASFEAPEFATLEGELRFVLAGPAQWAGATLRGGHAHYRDLGLAQNGRAAAALRSGADPDQGNAAFAALLLQWLAARGLPADTAMQRALGEFAASPTALDVRLDPPGALRPETLPQFAPADRAAALGLSLQTR